jgi:N-acetylglucosamine-6-phosphate deacetylase
MLDGLAAPHDVPGSSCLGFHLEGPYINPMRRGAFPVGTLRQPDLVEFAGFQAAARGRIRQVTFAPELDDGLALMAAIVASGAVAAVGHTEATFAEATAAFEGGATHVTHLFNAMRPLHHREGGPIAAALASPATCELIFDTAHVGADMLRLAYRLLGDRRLVVVTDNLYLAGAGRQAGSFAGGAVMAQGNVAVRDDATIAGSLLPMDGHFRNVIEVLGVGLEEAARLCATNAATVIGDRDRGNIRPGRIADAVIVDSEFDVVATICRGDLAYVRPGDEGRYRA